METSGSLSNRPLRPLTAGGIYSAAWHFAGRTCCPSSSSSWPAIDPATPLYAGGLLILAETASWTLEPHWPSRADPDMGRRRALRLAGMVLGAIALNIALFWVAAVPVASGLILTAGGVVAALGSLVLVAVVALIARGRGPS